MKIVIEATHLDNNAKLIVYVDVDNQFTFKSPQGNMNGKRHNDPISISGNIPINLTIEM